MTEASRRLVFLVIQNSKLERRATINERLRRTIAQENMGLNARLQRIISGEDRSSRQLIFENVFFANLMKSLYLTIYL